MTRSRIVKEVQKRLAGLPRYGVFDYLHFGIKGHTILLGGYASRPILKSDAEGAVKSIPGVQSVEDNIEVLPNSPNDDRIRTALYARVYGQPALRKYTGNALGLRSFDSIARAAGGITQDPPTGYHAIHLIVKNGNVTLRGVVNNQTDAAIAGMQANSTPGAFSVDNDLVYPGAKQPAAAR